MGLDLGTQSVRALVAGSDGEAMGAASRELRSERSNGCWQVLGQVSAAAARATGLARGTPVVAGMTDGCAVQIGAGALAPGDWNSVLGTPACSSSAFPAAPSFACAKAKLPC